MFVSWIRRLFTDYAKLGLVVGMTKQMSDGKEAGGKEARKSCRPNEVRST